MAVVIKPKRNVDLQGGKPPKKKPRGREPKLTAAKPRGGARIPVVEDDEPSTPVGNARVMGPPIKNGAGKVARVMGPPIKAEASKPSQPETETKFIPLGRLDPSPTNPRQIFDEAAIAELAESIRSVGLLQAILVRPKLHRYEIVAGESRWRAAKLAGLDQVECKVRYLDDWEVLKIQWAENAVREDISEIAEAKHFQRMLESNPELTQEQLAAEIGTSQAQIANRIRLLELSEDWQQRVISGEITASHARELVPFARHKVALDALAEAIARAGSPGSVKDFREAIEDEVMHAGIALAGEEWDTVSRETVTWRVPTSPDLREAWAVVEIVTDGKKVPFAIRLPEAEQQRERARQYRIDEARKKAEKRNKKDAAKSADAERTKDEQFARRLAAWKTDWLRVLCAQRLKEDDNAQIAETFFLAMVLEPDVWERRDGLTTICRRLKASSILNSLSEYERVRRAAALAGLDELRIEFARSLLVDEVGQPRQIVEPDDVDDLANALELPADLEAIWDENQAGDLSEAYWSLHNVEQLEALGEELGIEWRAKGKKGMVTQLLESANLKLPAELGGAKKSKRKGK